MSALESERELFLLFCMTLMVASPLVAWFIIPDRQDRTTRLWFSGAGMLGLVSVIFYIERTSSTLLITCNLLAGGLAAEALRSELRRRPVRWWQGLLVVTVIAATHEVMLRMGRSGELSGTWVLGSRVFVLTALELWIVVLTVQVARMHGSRGILLTSIGTGILALVNGVRLAMVLSGVPGMGPEIGSRAFPTLAAVLTFTSLTYSFGFVAFALERSRARVARTQEELARSQEREAAQRAVASTLQDLVAQRDEMLMTSSRLSAVRAMGLYNAAVVHEISQPLQALRAVLDGMRLAGAPGDPAAAAGSRVINGAELEHAAELAAKAGDIVQRLRQLLAARRTAVQPTNLNACVGAVLSVLKSEAARRGVDLECRLDPQLEERHAMIDPLMMQRVVMNLVGNSLDAVSTVDPPRRRVRLVTRLQPSDDGGSALLQVLDEGPGFPEAVLQHDGAGLIGSSKDQGMGIGLTLTRMLVTSWKGHFAVGPASGPDAATSADPAGRAGGMAPGARVDVLLPLI